MNQTKLLFLLIFISLEDDSSIVIPPQPTSPGEIMSGGEGEPVEADVPAEDETVSPQGMHVTGTQTVTHEYLTLNGKVARETIRTNNSLTAVLDFVYDDAGRPFALRYSTNGTSFQTYYYVLNLQGDVVKLIHYIPGFEYESVATYEYDAWGNIVSSSGRLAEINPLRYRGYYYDNETGFYYLQSRYYDPVKEDSSMPTFTPAQTPVMQSPAICLYTVEIILFQTRMNLAIAGSRHSCRKPWILSKPQ